MVDLRFESLGDGRIRVSTPDARGWARIAANPHQLAVTVGMAFTEATIAAYANWANRRYDLDRLTAPDDPTEHARRPVSGQRNLGRTTARAGRGRFTESSDPIGYGRGAVARPDTTHPSQYELTEDRQGYIHPSGRVFRSESFVARIDAKRAHFNLPIRTPA